MRIRIQHFTSDPDPARPLSGRPHRAFIHCGSAHFNADPDPAFHCLMRIRIQIFTSVQIRIQILLLIKMMGIYEASILRVHSPRRLYFEPLWLLNFDFNAVSDPAFHFNAAPHQSDWNLPTLFYTPSRAPPF
jgi:hypothetical protein